MARARQKAPETHGWVVRWGTINQTVSTPRKSEALARNLVMREANALTEKIVRFSWQEACRLNEVLACKLTSRPVPLEGDRAFDLASSLLAADFSGGQGWYFEVALPSWGPTVVAAIDRVPL